DLAVLLEQFQRRGVSLVSVAESLDTGSASGRLVLNIMVSVSQWEREAIGERTRDAMRHMKTKLEFVGNAPYGFRQAKDKRHVEPEPGEQAILERIQRLRKSGKSLRKIAEQLNRMKIRTRQGSPWRHEYVARLLKAAYSGPQPDHPGPEGRAGQTCRSHRVPGTACRWPRQEADGHRNGSVKEAKAHSRATLMLLRMTLSDLLPGCVSGSDP